MDNKVLELEINVADLRKAVSIAGGATPANAIVPAAECLLFELGDDNTISVTGTDTNFCVVTAMQCISATDQGARAFAAPLKFLSGLLSTLPDVPIRIDHYIDEVPKNRPSEAQLYVYGIEVVLDESRYNIPCENPKEFPRPNFTPSKTFSMSANQFSEGLRHTKGFYIPDDVARPNMAGVRLDLMSDLVKICAFCPTKGAFFETNDKAEVVGGFTIPDKLVKFLSGALSEQDKGTITFQVSDTMMRVEYGSFSVVAPLVEGVYPEYNQLVKWEHTFSTMVNFSEWKACIKRALIFSTDLGEVVHAFREDKLFLKSENNNYQTASEQHILIAEEIEEFDINLKGRDMLQSMPNLQGAVYLGMDQMTRPLYVIPQTHPGSRLLFMFMPFKEL